MIAKMVLTKQYSIGELAKLLNVSKSTLIYWSEKGYIPKPRRDNTLTQGRYWTQDDAQKVYEYKQAYYNRV